MSLHGTLFLIILCKNLGSIEIFTLLSQIPKTGADCSRSLAGMGKTDLSKAPGNVPTRFRASPPTMKFAKRVNGNPEVVPVEKIDKVITWLSQNNHKLKSYKLKNITFVLFLCKLEQFEKWLAQKMKKPLHGPQTKLPTIICFLNQPTT